MKKQLFILLLAVSLIAVSIGSYAQVQEAAQLALNIQKLNELRKILQNMYDGYKILTQGYNKVKDITQGNYKLHEVFLDGLMAVSPEIKNYRKVADIVSNQLRIVKEYKAAYDRFKSNELFHPEELEYMGKVYGHLTDQSLKNLDALLMVVTASNLRMSDAERLQTIDRLYEDVLDQLSFLRQFNNKAFVLAKQRAKETNDIITTERLYGIE